MTKRKIKTRSTRFVLYWFHMIYMGLIILLNPFFLLIFFGKIFSIEQLLILFFTDLILISILIFCVYFNQVSNKKKILIYVIPLLIVTLTGKILKKQSSSVNSEAIVEKTKVNSFLNYIDNPKNLKYRYENFYLVNPVSYNFENEHSVIYDSILGVNIRNSIQTKEDKDNTQVWFFGGSTMYSLTTNDSNTIPSIFKSLCFENKNKINVKNFGISGFNTSLELSNFIELLRRSEKYPEIVIFYDGYNDSVTRLSYDEIHINLREKFNYFGDNTLKSLLFYLVKFLNEENYFFKKILGNKILYEYFLNFKIPTVSETMINNSSKRYFKNIETISTISKSLGIESYFFLQPMPFTKNQLSNEEIERINKKTFEVGISVYGQIINRGSKIDNFFDISDSFNDVKKTIFIDEGGHVHNEGNKIISQRIFHEIRKNSKFIK